MPELTNDDLVNLFLQAQKEHWNKAALPFSASLGRKVGPMSRSEIDKAASEQRKLQMDPMKWKTTDGATGNGYLAHDARITREVLEEALAILRKRGSIWTFGSAETTDLPGGLAIIFLETTDQRSCLIAFNPSWK